ncbi:hypothetical protein [Allorhizocola rhizosphaerae]|uniref:hypothetical protein n=1 Tax=Allorhizocola rhizosphaerae TaxID=1872709 RepID=UPI0013C356BD|nr:hypothetical protein [Allorhizocola rhizosphaerae]
MPRELIRAPEHDRNRSLGWFATAWMEHFTVHGPGNVQGQPVTLDDELTEFVVDSYALDPSGRRLYDSAFLQVARHLPGPRHGSVTKSGGGCAMSG